MGPTATMPTYTNPTWPGCAQGPLANFSIPPVGTSSMPPPLGTGYPPVGLTSYNYVAGTPFILNSGMGGSATTSYVALF